MSADSYRKGLSGNRWGTFGARKHQVVHSAKRNGVLGALNIVNDGIADAVLAVLSCLAGLALVVLALRARGPTPGVYIYSATHYRGQRAVLAPGTAAPPFQPASVFAPAGLTAALTLTGGANLVTVRGPSSISVLEAVLPGSTVSSVSVTAQNM